MQSLRVVDKLEKDGQGLNLTWEVRNGIVTHTKGRWAATPEGRIVRMADQIAYVNHDIEDAVRAGVLDSATLPKDCTAVLGQTKSARITTMINSILAHSDGDVAVGAEENEAFLALRDFMYATVYVDKTAKAEEQKVDKVIGELYEYYLAHVDQMSNFYVQLAYQDDPERAVTDYISGMSDEFAIRTFEDVFVPSQVARFVKGAPNIFMIPHEYIEELTRRTDICGAGGRLCPAQAEGPALRRSVSLPQREDPLVLRLSGHPELLLLWLRCRRRCSDLYQKDKQHRLRGGRQAAGPAGRYARAHRGRQDGPSAQPHPSP